MPEELEHLEPLVGQWRMAPKFWPDGSDAPRARTDFQWMSGRHFLIQRWEVDHPDAPDGVAIIGFDAVRNVYVQHYFDSRGVERRYDMGFTNNVWTLERLADDPDFSQRFVGRFSQDGTSIVGSWERSDDRGSNWTHDFDLTYSKVPSRVDR
jgi:hypothetical protein